MNQQSRIIGRRECPYCKQEVAVVNDDGLRGHAQFNYLENHTPPSGSQLCEGSEKMLRDL